MILDAVMAFLIAVIDINPLLDLFLTPLSWAILFFN